MLDEWEKKVDDGLLHRDLFLTQQTAEGLRVTLKSTLELTCYLINDFGFKELQTGRVNQDALEVCLIIVFGIMNFILFDRPFKTELPSLTSSSK